MNVMTFVVGVFVGANVGVLLSAWLRYISYEDAVTAEYEALKRVHAENGSLSAPTRAAVIDAIENHKTRWPDRTLS